MSCLRTKQASQLAQLIIKNWNYGNSEHYDAKKNLINNLPKKIILEISNYKSEDYLKIKLKDLILELGNGFISKYIDDINCEMPYKFQKKTFYPGQQVIGF